MKRPDGFDAAPSPRAPAKQPGRAPAPLKPAESKRTPSLNDGESEQVASSLPKSEKGKKGERFANPKVNKVQAAPRRVVSPAKLAQKQARAAAKERRRYERSEVRRFTRRSRHRRVAWFTTGGVVVVLGALIAIAVYSPLLALQRIEILGASRLAVEELQGAVDGQMGTPLALLDFEQLKGDLSQFTLIRSYVTEMVPPHTLVIHISEREPVGSVMSTAGYTLVDPAGVEIEQSATRPPSVPIIDAPDADKQGPVFRAVVEVLLALPEPVLAQVDAVTATTMDDVTLVFAGVGQRVVWGSADRSELKARVLEKLVALQDPGTLVEYDVTAPLSAVVRPG